MLVFAQFTYAAPPKTATTWVSEAFRLTVGDPPDKTGKHRMGTLPDRPSITSVRDPLAWLGSCWLAVGGPMDIPAMDCLYYLNYPPPGRKKPRKRRTFDDFIEQYLEQMPGHVSTVLFPHYASDFTIRAEHCADDFCHIMDALGIDCNHGAIHRIGVVNSSSPMKGPHPVWSEELRQRVMEAEGMYA